MLSSQRLLIEQSEVRQRLSAALGKDELTDDERAKMDADTKRAQQIETEYRAALVVEGEPTETPSEDGEGRELRELEQRASIGNYASEIINDIVLTGAELELRAAVFGDNVNRGTFPLQMLLSPAELRAWHDRHNERETRARTPVAAAAVTEGNQESIAARVFSRSVMAFFNVPMPTQALGSAGFPHLSGGTTFSQQAIGAEQAAVAGSFGGVELTPIRATASYEFSAEDVVKLAGLEEAFRRDLRDGLSNLMSVQALRGNGSGANVEGIQTAIAATPSTDPANVDDFGEITQRFGGEVDGINAYGMSDLRILMAAGTYAHAITQYRGNATNMSAYDWLMERAGAVQVSSLLPAPASDISLNVVHKTSYPERSATAPIWQGVQFIADPYSMATSGVTKLTALLLWNFKVLADDAWANIKIHD